ncbi:cytochrome c [Thiomicrospira sp. ALE5]|uniref:c-type cytochrome n=1 Tax=Thiomicrospira sp. ALE5 TaxID=748650 RepID=UPI0008E1D77A|nr:cytochrome c [Thiomicrospira sp. ALE5]SFR63231.1 Cytochrome c553 [Thiomicrospira sp. ALE5]
MNKKSMVLAVSLGLMTASNVAVAQTAGQPAKLNTCIGCHGADGNSTVPNFPKLAGQHAAYLEKALKDYRDGFRRDESMAAFARGLTDEEIRDLAEYYSQQTPQ